MGAQVGLLVCAWALPGCDWLDREAATGAPTSHGCCPSCARSVLAEARARVTLARRLGDELRHGLDAALDAGDLLTYPTTR